MIVKSILPILLIILTPVRSFGQEEDVFDFNDEFWMIDAVRLSHENDTFQMRLFCHYLTSASWSWTKMAGDLCTYRLQQMGKLPYSGSEPLITTLSTPNSFREKEETYVQPQIRQLGFALLPLYRHLCTYSINHFSPAQIETFEKTVRYDILNNPDFYLQDLLLSIAQTSRRYPNPDTRTLITKMVDYFKQFPYGDTQILDFVKERYEDQLKIEDEPVLIDH